MKIHKPFTGKRILAIILGAIVLGFLAFMLFTPGSSVKDTAGEMAMISGFMGALSLALFLYGIFGGKEPEIGIIPKAKKDEKDDRA